MGLDRATVRTPLNKSKSYSSGGGGTQAEQRAELQTKLLLVVGDTLTVTETQNLLSTDYPTGFSIGSNQQFAIGVINMYRNGAGEEPPIVHATVEVPFMSKSFIVANTNLITTSGNAVANFIAAYRDNQGVGGYAADAVAPSFYKLGKKA